MRILYMMTVTDLQGNYKSYELFNVDPESTEMISNQGQPSEVISDDVLQAKMNLPDDLGGIKPYDVLVNTISDKIYVYGNQGLMVIIKYMTKIYNEF